MNKEITICKGCGRRLDKIDIWDEKKGLCDKCSMKNADSQTINTLNLSYIN